MKKNNQLLKSAALLCTAFSMGFTPVSAQDFEDTPLTTQTTPEDSSAPSLEVSDSQLPSDTQTSSEVSDSSSISDSQAPSADDSSTASSEVSEGTSSDSSSVSDQRPADTAPIVVSPQVDSATEGSSKQEGSEDENSSSENQNKEDAPITFESSKFDSSKNELTCSFTLNEVPENLAYQFNWTTSERKDGDETVYGPVISEKPVNVSIGSRNITTSWTLLTTKEGEGQYKLNFTEDDLKDAKAGDVVSIVFQAYPSLESSAPGNAINYTQQVYTGDQIKANESLALDPKDHEGLYLDSESSITVTQDLVVTNTYMPDTKTWQMKIEMKEKPEELKVTLKAEPDVLDCVNVKARLNDKDVKVETENNTADKTNTIVFSADDVKAMDNKSVITLDFPVSVSSSSTDKKVKVSADVDNGIHILPLDIEFEAVADSTFKASYDYDKANQTFTAKVTLNDAPGNKFILTFGQNGNYLKNPTSFKLKNGTEETELKPTVNVTKGTGGYDQYEISFSSDDLAKMKKDSQFTVVFPVNAEKKADATVNLKIEDQTTTKELVAKFTIEPNDAAKGSNVPTSTNTGMYAALAALVAAAIGIVFFAFKSRKSK